MHRHPLRVQAVRQPPRPPNHLRGERTRDFTATSKADAPGFPRPLNLHHLADNPARPVPRVPPPAAARHFPQRRQIAFAEKNHHRHRRAIPAYRPCLRRAAASRVFRQKYRNQLNVTPNPARCVRHGFVHGRTGDFLNGLRAALDMLDIQRGVTINARTSSNSRISW